MNICRDTTGSVIATEEEQHQLVSLPALLDIVGPWMTIRKAQGFGDHVAATAYRKATGDDHIHAEHLKASAVA